MDAGKQYLQTILDTLGKIGVTQSGVIEDAAQLFFSVFRAGGSLYAFGASHAGIIAEELFARAGGLMVVNPVFNPTLMLNTRPFTLTSAMERLEGFGTAIFDNSPMKEGDALLIHSVSGRNSVAIDLALAAKKKGVSLVAITNLDYGRHVKSRHSSGRLLSELCDIVIDNCGVYGDAAVEIGSVTAGGAPPPPPVRRGVRPACCRQSFCW